MGSIVSVNVESPDSPGGIHRHRPERLSTAKFLTAIYCRLLPTGLSHLAGQAPAGALKTADRAHQHALDTLTHTTGLAADHRSRTSHI